MKRRWSVAPKITDEIRAGFPELTPALLQLLWNRGLKDQTAIDEFLNPDYGDDLHDPFLFRDMRRAVRRLLNTARNGERIAVHGDYDADGVCAAALLATTLEAVGAKVQVFLPHRELDGYGLNEKTVDEFARDGVKAIVTCDCGIANAGPIAKAESLGMNVIVTDHHALPAELPQAFVTIHPLVPGETYPWKGLAGGGVAFKLAQAIIKTAEAEGAELSRGFEKWLLDLAAISSVADMVPLLGETRTIVKYGLVVLAKTKRIGLRRLMEATGVFDETGTQRRPVDTHTIGFQIAPRINAAGRLDHANAAYALLVEKDPERARELAVALEAANSERQRQTDLCVTEARGMIKENGWENDPAIVAAGDWPPGLLGLIAGRLMDEFYRPVFAVSLRDNCVGSGRSIPEYHLMDAMGSLGDIFEKFGGHPQACGFTLKRGMTDELRARLIAHAAEVFGERELVPELSIDAEIALEAVDWNFCETVKTFEPFGVGNLEPKFLARDLRVEEIFSVGADAKHLRLTVSHWSGERRKMIAFGFGPGGNGRTRELEPGAKIDAVFNVGVNEWNGNREIQLKVVDFRTAEEKL